MNDKHDTETGASLLSYKQVAHLAGVPVGTVYSWVAQQKIPHVRLGPRLVRFDWAEIRAWLDARRVPAVAHGADQA